MNLVANVLRGGIMESSHLGHIAVVDAKGKLAYFYGDPFRLTYGRSSIKPMQAVPVVETGTADRFSFSQADLAVCCASHSGEERHRTRVLDILRRAGQAEDVLQCGFHIPADQASYIQLIQAGRQLTPCFSNCSGKHSGMVATAVHIGEDTQTYLSPDHPVQQRILQAIADITCYPQEKIHIGLDGCGAPVHLLPLYNLAWGFARMAAPDEFQAPSRRAAVGRVTDAMIAAPEMVGGNRRYCTDLMTAFAGRIFGKSGADGVYCLGDRERQLGIALKIEDGSSRAKYAVMNEILRQLDIGVGDALERLGEYTNPALKNFSGKVVGSIQTEFALKAGQQ